MAKTFETSPAPRIVLTGCAGNLTIVGSDTTQVIVEADGADSSLTTQREGETITLGARSDCYITCPARASLTLQEVTGNLRVRGVGGPLALASARGNVSLRQIGPATLQAIAGDVDANRVNGDLSLGQVQGDARVRRVEGKLTLEHCGGDLDARDLAGGADARDVRGNAGLRGELTPGQVYRLRAHGDIQARFPAQASARCAFEAGGQVQCDLALTKSEVEPHRIVGQLGAGEAQVELRADGDVSVRGASPDWDASVDVHIEAHLAELERRLEEKLAGLDHLGVRIGEKMRRRAEKQAERARRQAEKARRQAEKEAEKARRRSSTGFRFTWSSPAEPARAPAAESVEEERLAILRMVEQKKVSAGEAALLLDALEGQPIE